MALVRETFCRRWAAKFAKRGPTKAPHGALSRSGRICSTRAMPLASRCATGDPMACTSRSMCIKPPLALHAQPALEWRPLRFVADEVPLTASCRFDV
jgi:hypothetical protein